MQVANAKIMNKGTPTNILTQLHMTANEYNLITTVYYVRIHRILYSTLLYCIHIERDSVFWSLMI